MRFVLFLLILFALHTKGQSLEEVQDKLTQHMETGDYAAALPLVEQLIAARPEFFLYRQDRAAINFQLKNFAAAVRDFKYLISIAPATADYYFQTGNIYELMDSTSQVELYYSKAIELDEENYMYFFKRGTFYLKRNLYLKAIKDFNATLELFPEHDNSYHNRAIARYKTGDREGACEDWCRALLLENPYSGAHLERNCKQYSKECLPVK